MAKKKVLKVTTAVFDMTEKASYTFNLLVLMSYFNLMKKKIHKTHCITHNFRNFAGIRLSGYIYPKPAGITSTEYG